MFHSPFDQPSYKPKAKKKKAKKKVAKKKVAKKKARKRAPRKLATAETCDPGTVVRSPCGAFYDPKITFEEIAEARELVAKHPGKKLHRRVAMDRDGVPKGKYIKIEGRRGKGAWKPDYVKTGKPHRPLPARPLAVAYGLGLDSTAILCGLVQEARRARTKREREIWTPKVISFADVGSEKGVTYKFLQDMNEYLVEHGFPPVTVVAWRTQFTAKGWGSAETLEQQVLLNQSGPSITEYFGSQSKCSSLWKQQPQNDWMQHSSGLWERVRARGTRGVWRPIGGHIVKAIGYDATEERRMAPDGGGAGATFRINLKNKDEKKQHEGYRYWYPLVEWGWDRARCRAEVESEMGEAPTKSSCTFCFAMKPEEIVSLSKDEMKRAAFMELVRRHGRQAFRFKWKAKNGLASQDPEAGVKGLAGGWSWTDLFVNGAMDTLAGKYSEERRRAIDAKVRQRFGTRTCLSRREVNQLDRLAQQFVARSADKGRSVQVDTLSKARIVKALGELPKLGKTPDLAGWRKVYKWALGKRAPSSASAKELAKIVFTEMRPESERSKLADSHYKGKFDMADDAWLRRLPAFSKLNGFRGDPQMTWARNPDDASGYTVDTLEIPTDLYGIAWPV